jgi:hypothetical protein
VDESDEVERVLPGWRALAESVAEELTAWRRAHPRATLTEIETVVFEVGQRLQSRALEQVVQASAAVDLAAQPEGEWPACPACGGRLEARGRQRRRIRPARQRTVLEVDRSYAVCATCGGGLFPLDEELELLSGELSATLAEGVTRVGTRMPFAQAAAELAFFWGVERAPCIWTGTGAAPVRSRSTIKAITRWAGARGWCLRIRRPRPGSQSRRKRSRISA